MLMAQIDIPPSRRVNCQFCHQVIDSNASGTWQVVKGWCPIKRYAGNKKGTNSVSLVHWLFVFACGECISKLKAGLPAGQQELPFFNMDDV
jgi:hypothetical protein